MSFAQWIDCFVDEKGFDREHRFEKEGPSGLLNSIPLGNVIAAMKIAPTSEQQQIKHQIVMLDFRNADILDYLGHLAGALAI